MVKSKYDDYRLSMKKWAGRISLESLDRALGMHKPPLKAKLINNGPINIRGDGTVASPFNDGEEYELEAETLPGKAISCTCITVSCTAVLIGHIACVKLCYANVACPYAGFEPFLAYPQISSATRWLSSWMHT